MHPVEYTLSARASCVFQAKSRILTTLPILLARQSVSRFCFFNPSVLSWCRTPRQCNRRVGVGALRSLQTTPLFASVRAYGRGPDPNTSAYEQFQSQQGQYHRHSLHEKGHRPRSQSGGGDHARGTQQEGTGNSNRGNESEESEKRRAESNDNKHDWDGEGYEDGYSRAEAFTRKAAEYRTSATAQERRDMSRNWENAFFGRVHYEEGMHDRFQQALDAEEHERIASKTNEELFPDWPADEEAPPHLFKKISPALQLRYILNRLAMGERRVRYAVDYGSLSMMYQLNLGESMVAEAEHLLLQLGWMNEELQEKIEEVKATANKVKYDYDLD